MEKVVPKDHKTFSENQPIKGWEFQSKSIWVNVDFFFSWVCPGTLLQVKPVHFAEAMKQMKRVLIRQVIQEHRSTQKTNKLKTLKTIESRFL